MFSYYGQVPQTGKLEFTMPEPVLKLEGKVLILVTHQIVKS